jgi:hypothetical protein
MDYDEYFKDEFSPFELKREDSHSSTKIVVRVPTPTPTDPEAYKEATSNASSTSGKHPTWHICNAFGPNA